MSWNKGGKVRATKIGPGLGLPWTSSEDKLLAEGFLDRDLEDAALHAWMRSKGCVRSPGSIDRRLHHLKFFEVEADKKRRLRQLRSDNEQRIKHMKNLARRQLANEITRAHIEAADAPPYKNPKAWERL